MRSGADPTTLLDQTDFAISWAALTVGHTLADHVFGQNDHIANNKGAPTAEEQATGQKNPHDGWKENLQHVALYHVTMGAAVLATRRALGVRTNPRGVAAALLWSAATHSIIDRRWPVRRLLQATGSPRFAELRAGGMNGMYLADQALHHGCLLVSALLMAKVRGRRR